MELNILRARNTAQHGVKSAQNVKSGTISQCCKSRIVHSVGERQESISENLVNNLQDTSRKRKSVYANMIVNGYTVRFQIDTGATTNLIPRKYIPEETIIATDSTLTMWNGAKFSPAGHCYPEYQKP